MSEELAKKRFMILNLVRFSALAFIFAGAANIGGKLLPDLTPTLGYILLVIGAVDFFLAPVMLKRMWRTPE
jgi:hypothetical protein